MKYIAGVDIGNSTTEVCIGLINDRGMLKFLASANVETTGTKGTPSNVEGIKNALIIAMDRVHKKMDDLSVIRINEAAPVIGDTAMETITETIITESTMIGHNPDTPAGAGIGTGYIYPIEEIDKLPCNRSYICLVSKDTGYEQAAEKINRLMEVYEISAVVVQEDEAVLIYNRLNKKIPIVDEVKYIDKIEIGMKAAVEVAPEGHTITRLSNPYGIASIFQLNAEETRHVVPIAKSFVGSRSAIFIRTPKGSVKEQSIKAGELTIHGEKSEEKVKVDLGADEIMKSCNKVAPIVDIDGESGTNIGIMIDGIKKNMHELTGQEGTVKIQDILAVDTLIPVDVKGALAGEVSMENAVGIAAMVKTEHLPMEKIARRLQDETGVHVKIAGVEAVMASLGAWTTPGTELPLAILDLGGGSTDAAILDETGLVKSVHLAGAGQLITLLINTELGLNDLALCEHIKRNPLAKVESLFHIRMENKDIKFFDKPMSPKLFGKVVVMDEEKMIPINSSITMEKIVDIRKSIKKKVFVQNAIRALTQIAPDNHIRNIPNIVLVGGSALDFEIPDLILNELSKYKIVSGRGNIRNCEGPRNAVATGLLMSYKGQGKVL
ncbi:diol dehydratase reactivase subunit alpha [Vallitalea sp.]|jgi:diol dehydratase reactivase alpha subunit|uniref:diol dehydratase reactivase subunit alpha n=1 Tax=Vallitalea sp. TaxID=1882829 RepID=UPI0025F90793|nr:diol dehydratase reactivase subunit alpha [Vallitalea sp.]MCT4685835.1 diol dehydratase reactivase subunit alpha [Vallitalea sp.]